MLWSIPNWRLVAMMPAIGDDGLYWILASNESKEYGYVIAKYRSNSKEWNHGHYFDDRNDALGYWMTTTIENTPITDIDIHPRLGMNVAKLSKIVNIHKSKKEW
jgi:hypothetical protein